MKKLGDQARGLLTEGEEQAEVPVDKVLPRPGFLSQAAAKQTVVNLGRRQTVFPGLHRWNLGFERHVKHESSQPRMFKSTPEADFGQDASEHNAFI